MALQLRPNCELCDRDLPPDATEARICSFECTFCADCVEHVLANVCANCGGGLSPRPIRPRQAWRAGVSLAEYPASTARVHCKYDVDTVRGFAARLAGIAPAAR